PHHVVQNSRRTTFPLTESFENLSPSVVLAVNRGARSLARGPARVQAEVSSKPPRNAARKKELRVMGGIYHELRYSVVSFGIFSRKQAKAMTLLLIVPLFFCCAAQGQSTGAAGQEKTTAVSAAPKEGGNEALAIANALLKDEKFAEAAAAFGAIVEKDP